MKDYNEMAHLRQIEDSLIKDPSNLHSIIIPLILMNAFGKDFVKNIEQ